VVASDDRHFQQTWHRSTDCLDANLLPRCSCKTGVFREAFIWPTWHSVTLPAIRRGVCCSPRIDFDPGDGLRCVARPAGSNLEDHHYDGAVLSADLWWASSSWWRNLHPPRRTSLRALRIAGPDPSHQGLEQRNTLDKGYTDNKYSLYTRIETFAKALFLMRHG
jgi:hypothetical protein